MSDPSLLREMVEHQAWADAELWRAIRACPPALRDEALRQRLHHTHLVQQAFLCQVAGGPFTLSSPADYPGDALEQWARSQSEAWTRWLAAVPAARLGETVRIPWFVDPPLELTVERAVAQAAMHSHYHRGQNATRLRELGGEPPHTDFIFWHWKGRPAPAWGA